MANLATIIKLLEGINQAQQQPDSKISQPLELARTAHQLTDQQIALCQQINILTVGDVKPAEQQAEILAYLEAQSVEEIQTLLNNFNQFFANETIRTRLLGEARPNIIYEELLTLLNLAAINKGLLLNLEPLTNNNDIAAAETQLINPATTKFEKNKALIEAKKIKLEEKITQLRQHYQLLLQQTKKLKTTKQELQTNLDNSFKYIVIPNPGISQESQIAISNIHLSAANLMKFANLDQAKIYCKNKVNSDLEKQSEPQRYGSNESESQFQQQPKTIDTHNFLIVKAFSAENLPLLPVNHIKTAQLYRVTSELTYKPNTKESFCDVPIYDRNIKLTRHIQNVKSDTKFNEPKVTELEDQIKKIDTDITKLEQERLLVKEEILIYTKQIEKLDKLYHKLKEKQEKSLFGKDKLNLKAAAIQQLKSSYEKMKYIFSNLSPELSEAEKKVAIKNMEKTELTAWNDEHGEKIKAERHTKFRQLVSFFTGEKLENHRSKTKKELDAIVQIDETSFTPTLKKGN